MRGTSCASLYPRPCQVPSRPSSTAPKNSSPSSTSATFEGRAPRIDRTAFVHDAAEIIGAVSLGREASVWPGVVLRGDVDSITVDVPG